MASRSRMHSKCAPRSEDNRITTTSKCQRLEFLQSIEGRQFRLGIEHPLPFVAAASESLNSAGTAWRHWSETGKLLKMEVGNQTLCPHPSSPYWFLLLRHITCYLKERRSRGHRRRKDRGAQHHGWSLPPPSFLPLAPRCFLSL